MLYAQTLPTRVCAYNGRDIGALCTGSVPRDFGGAGVVEVIENLQGDTFRVVYTVKFEDAVCVLHCFQKKSSSGSATSRQDMATMKSTLAQALKERGR